MRRGKGIVMISALNDLLTLLLLLGVVIDVVMTSVVDVLHIDVGLARWIVLGSTALAIAAGAGAALTERFAEIED